MKRGFTSFVISNRAACFGARGILSIATAVTLVGGYVCSEGHAYGEAAIGLSMGPVVLLNDIFHPEGIVFGLMWFVAICLIIAVIIGLFGLLGTAVLGCPLLALWPRLVAWPLRLAAWSLGLLAVLLAGGLGAALWLTTRPDVEGPTIIDMTHFFVPSLLVVLALGYARLHHEVRHHE